MADVIAIPGDASKEDRIAAMLGLDYLQYCELRRRLEEEAISELTLKHGRKPHGNRLNSLVRDKLNHYIAQTKPDLSDSEREVLTTRIAAERAWREFRSTQKSGQRARKREHEEASAGGPEKPAKRRSSAVVSVERDVARQRGIHPTDAARGIRLISALIARWGPKAVEVFRLTGCITGQATQRALYRLITSDNPRWIQEAERLWAQAQQGTVPVEDRPSKTVARLLSETPEGRAIELRSIEKALRTFADAARRSGSDDEAQALETAAFLVREAHRSSKR